MQQACECSDPGCPAHEGISSCVNTATETLTRSDMCGARVDMCSTCADDAMASGVFATTDED